MTRPELSEGQEECDFKLISSSMLPFFQLSQEAGKTVSKAFDGLTSIHIETFFQVVASLRADFYGQSARREGQCAEDPEIFRMG